MRILKKALIFTLAFALLVSMLYGCGKDESKASAGKQNVGSAQKAKDSKLEPLPNFKPLDWDKEKETPEGDFTYVLEDGYVSTLNESTTYVRLTGYTGSASVLKIPEIIKGYPVCMANPDLFAGNTAITHVSLPSNLVLDGEMNGFFAKCTSLLQVQMPVDCDGIPASMFEKCSALRQVDFPTSGKSLSLQSIVGRLAFWGCASLTSIVLPDHMFAIYDSVFEDCIRLKSVEAPGVSHVLQSAFDGCENLEKLTLNASVDKLEGKAFFGCSSLKTIHTVETAYHSGKNLCVEGSAVYVVDTNQNDVTLMCVLEGYEGNTVDLRKDTTEINRFAFEHSGIKTVELPASVRKIDSFAFEYCPNLESVTLAEGSKLHTLCEDAFFECSALKTIDLSNAPQDLEVDLKRECFFSHCPSLEKALLPDGTNAAEPDISETAGKDGVTKAIQEAFAPYQKEMDAAGFEYKITFKGNVLNQAFIYTHKKELTDSERELLKNVTLALLRVPETGLEPDLLQQIESRYDFKSFDAFVYYVAGADKVSFVDSPDTGLTVSCNNN